MEPLALNSDQRLPGVHASKSFHRSLDPLPTPRSSRSDSFETADSQLKERLSQRLDPAAERNLIIFFAVTRNAEQLSKMAHHYFLDKNWGNVIVAYSAFLSLNPADRTARTRRAIAYFETGEWHRSCHDCYQIIGYHARRSAVLPELYTAHTHRDWPHFLFACFHFPRPIIVV